MSAQTVQTDHRRSSHPGSQLTQMATNAHQLFDSLLAPQTRPLHMLQWLQEFSELVDCMALNTAEYGLAKIRIKNAIRFLESSEVGAAKFEIRQLRGGLKEHLHVELEPQRALFPHRQHRAAVDPMEFQPSHLESLEALPPLATR